MEEKKVTKINLSTFILILALIVIVVMAIFIYKFYTEKVDATEKSTELQGQISNLNETISNLQGKLDEISSTINSNTTNSDDNSSSNKTSSSQLSTQDTIKELFLAKLKALDNSNSEKLLDYRVDKIEILNDKEDQSFIELGYNLNDILAYVTYSVKPKNVNTSTWLAGNGEAEGGWIINKVACECLRNGKLVDSTGLNTGW